MAKTLQEVLREKAQLQQINTGNITDAALVQLKASRKYGEYTGEAQPAKPAAHGEVTMDKFREDIRSLFDEGAQLGFDKKGVVAQVVKTAQELSQAEKAQGQPLQTATSAAVTTQFSNQNAPEKPASVVPPITSSGPKASD